MEKIDKIGKKKKKKKKKTLVKIYIYMCVCVCTLNKVWKNITYSKGRREASFHSSVLSSICLIIHPSCHGLFTLTRRRKSGIQTRHGEESNRKRWHTSKALQ